MSAPSSKWINNTISKIIHNLFESITGLKEYPLVMITNISNPYKVNLVAETLKVHGKNTIRFYYENLFRYIEGKEYSYDVKYPILRYKLLKVVIHELFHIVQNKKKFLTIDELEDNINEQTIIYLTKNKDEIEKWYGRYNIPRENK